VVEPGSGQDQHVSEPVEVSLDDRRATVALRGEFDMPATFTVEPALESLVARADVDAITVDLSRLSFIDSTGVGVLIRLDEESRARGMGLRIVPGPREVQRVFELAGLDAALPFTAGPVEIAVAGGTATVALHGELDLATTFLVEPQLTALLDRGDVTSIVVDLGGLWFIDSTGVGALLRLDEGARERGVGLRLLPGPPDVQVVFAVAGLRDVLPFPPEAG
jgi:anti-sigma B factor antagonist